MKYESPMVRRLSTKTVLCPLLLVLATPSPSTAAVYRARGVAGLPVETRIEFAELAAPTWELVENEGVSLRDVVRSSCGDQGTDVNRFLEEKARELNRVESIDKVVPAGSTVAVPVCFRIDPLPTITVELGDTVEELLRIHYGVHGPVTQNAVYELNADRYPGKSPTQFTMSLRPGTEIVLPYAAEPRTFVWADHGDVASPAELVSSLPLHSVAEPFTANLEVVEGFADPFRFRSVPFVEAASAEEGAGCEVGNPLQLVRNLAERVREEVEALEREGKALEKTVLGVVDTGIAREDIFFEVFLEGNALEEMGDPQIDDDDPPNDFVDDVFGISLESRNGSIFSSPTDNPIGHGTKVATVAMTGLDYEQWITEVPESPLKLKVVSYSSNRFVGGGVDAVHLSRVPDYLHKQSVAIVNMSLSSGHRPVPLSDAFATHPGLLFVVAAGNAKSGGGKELGPELVFPAMYGGRIGDFSRHVLTVGAHDGTGRLAPFSNFSREHVDLLAPGCGVKTRDENGGTVAEHGTSMATAAVSFGAGLIRSLGLEGSGQIKNRILATTDRDPRLASTVWASGRLNLVKAISLRHDVIEAADGLHFGELRHTGGFTGLCEAPLSPSLGRIRKIVPNLIEADARIRMELWVERDERLYRVYCDQTDDVAPLELVQDDGSVVILPLASIRDIVPARF